MSEYQFVAFRAIDVPVSNPDLAFMRKQSTRAEITPWSFENEYDYGDFRGDAAAMLRRGYDVFLHYANFGTRTLMIRFESGLPNLKACKPYFDNESFLFAKDKGSPSGILMVGPYFEAGTLEEIWKVDKLIDQMLPLRDEIAAGDLRPLYLMSLATKKDDDHEPSQEVEPPIPAGLDKLTYAQQALAKFFEIDDRVIDAAAQSGPPLPRTTSQAAGYKKWLSQQSAMQKEHWLLQVMSDNAAELKRELLKEYRKSTKHPTWPTTSSTRTIAELYQEARKSRRAKNSKSD